MCHQKTNYKITKGDIKHLLHFKNKKKKNILKIGNPIYMIDKFKEFQFTLQPETNINFFQKDERWRNTYLEYYFDIHQMSPGVTSSPCFANRNFRFMNFMLKPNLILTNNKNISIEKDRNLQIEFQILFKMNL